MKSLMPIVAVVLLLGAVAAFVQAVRISDAPSLPGEPWTPPERPEVVNRCAAEGFAQIRWIGADPESRPTRDLIEQYSQGVVPDGRHGGEAGIQLGELLPEAAAVELVPCVGEPIRFSQSDLRTGQGIWLVPNQRGAMKAIDFRVEPRGQLITRAVHSLEPIAD
ncbi:hypothetical protein HFP89_06985 [Wenzhouxiangella sp. XN79A]|uniref:hypothetical protein n=1 Tax=Wenzhouxiangella sp. XN79A TaxID=2724193 RepID=UPI00144ABE66|nr:hypothetical protein [Wenzhouxiangella sp. XN79A]NKI34905.1 hypothetical protein [Wenzhouxiangella sp. XN79A]